MRIASSGRTQKALELLQLTRSADLTGIAKELNVSSSRLRHILSKHLGQSPGRYVKALKLEQARGLLCAGYLSVKEVMASVGFQDTSHSVRDYKLAFGQTPSETRRQRS
ncbi:MAG: helix-turn-helix transcriptional regulator [Acidobacteriales bacterium]|nr:helix-turn-helix transcriptional regulator [Terriglobales bacterium]